MLDEDAAKAGRNFLTPAIRALADTRIAEGGGMVDADRLRRNMLSSQPMCFNLFGELAAEPRHGTSLVRALWGDHIGEVTSVRFEWAPTPASEYLSDKTAFDAFIEYDASDGKPGFIAIETKLTEPFSQTVYDGDKYRRWMTQDAPWREDAQPRCLTCSAQPVVARPSAGLGPPQTSRVGIRAWAAGGRLPRRGRSRARGHWRIPKNAA